MTIFSVPVKRLGTSIEIDTDKFPANAQEHVLQYGWRQILNDAHAPAESDDEAKALVEKRLAALQSGDIRAMREGNPVESQAMDLARAAVRTAIRKSGKKVADYKGSAITDLAKAYLAKYPAVRETAKAMVAQRQDVPEASL